MSIVNHLINSDTGTLILIKDDSTYTEIMIDGAEHNRAIIEQGNNDYREFQFNHRTKNDGTAKRFLDGCLPSVCLMSLKNLPPSVNLSTRYLINTFLEHMELIFGDAYGPDIFQRDDPHQVPVPISDANIEALYQFMMDKLNGAEEEETPNDNDLHTNNKDNENLHFLLKLTLQYLMGLKEESEKRAGKVSKHMRKIKKGSNLMGGLEVSQMEDSLGEGLLGKEDITENLKESAQKIKEFIWAHRAEIASRVAKHDYVNKVLRTLDADPQTPLYVQYQVSFTDMFEAIGEIFRVVLYTMIPQTSSLLTLQASFYNCAFLYQLGLMEKYKDLIFTPFLYRLTYSCFKLPPDRRYEGYMKEKYESIVTRVMKLSSCPEQAEIFCHIASNLDLSDSNCVNGLYWCLNEVRGCTFEFYLILLAHIFVNTQKCRSLNKLCRLSSLSKFIGPLHRILTKYKDYVQKQGLEVALSSHTLQAFNTLYKNEISAAIKEFSVMLITKPQ